MPKAKTPTIDFKMYRHFAVVTLAATAMLVMFAEGENGKAEVAGHEIAYEEPAADTTEQEPQELAVSGAATQGSWGSTGATFGQPMVSQGGGNSSVFSKARLAPKASDKPTAEQQQAWDAAERRSLQRGGGGQSRDR